MRIVYLVITTQKYHSNRVEAIARTWGSTCSSDLLYMSDALGQFPNIIKLDVGSDYKSASPKTVAAISYLRGQPYEQSEWFMVCDDDTFVFTEHLQAFLASQDPSCDHCFCQLLNHYPELPDLHYPSGGAGYVFSKSALQKLYKTFPHCTMYPYSDVTIGVCLKEAAVIAIDTPGFYSQPPEKTAQELHKCGQAIVAKPLTFHYITPELMDKLYHMREIY